ncbi:GNAT family N-acetyltransferase [Flavobacteriaceae bacterium TP-CH-4]|uniref:GNAT family N-acetyltransferase n=1 Tax=Pelagihabitans pacificus TaxID=2696054 RepID=A0A967AUF3_9FLAO|nr:GNAT family N-acetyltransferase [Pelagihabitans pacificus]NHF60142.1 GNAT family N-acetyltransferase [Pelagihabitans pacificus]
MIRATQKDKKLVVDILVEAFDPIKGDNSINFIVRHDTKRLYRMRVLMEYLFDKALRTGEVFLSDNFGSCLLITYAHKDRFSVSKVISTLRLVLFCIGFNRLRKVLRRQKIVQRNYPKGEYIRPMIFAVKQEYKGTVTAAKLIMQVYKEKQHLALPIIVDTASEELVGLYRKFGLRIFNTETELGFPIYMLRMEGVPPIKGERTRKII